MSDTHDYRGKHESEVQDDQLSESDEPSGLLMLNSRVYDKLKFVAQILLPGVAAAYFALAGIWGLPNAQEVVGTITVLDTVLGLFLGAANRVYVAATEGAKVGFIDVTESPDPETPKKMELFFPGDPHEIDKHDKVTFKVRKK